MVLENPILPFREWLTGTTLPFLITVIGVAAAGLLIGYLAAALRHGPAVALKMTTRTLSTAVRELVQLSPRRLWAMTRLAFQESIRRRVLVVFVVFVVALLFAGWFLDRESEHPARLYLSFVLTATNYLVLVLAIFISAFSLPNDLKNKTIFTVVTKPVRGWEIILGRILGFVGIGTLLLALMCLFSYFFVRRGLQHTHRVDPARLVAEPEEMGRRGESTLERNHRHEVVEQDDETLMISPNHDHTHKVTSTPETSRRGVYELGTTQGLLTARVPILGTLRYLDSAGNPGEGTNVGYEWAYRRYIEGQFGYHIIKKTDVRAARKKPYAEVREQIEKSLLARQRNQAIRDSLEAWKKEANIEILEKADPAIMNEGSAVPPLPPEGTPKFQPMANPPGVKIDSQAIQPIEMPATRDQPIEHPPH